MRQLDSAAISAIQPILDAFPGYLVLVDERHHIVAANVAVARDVAQTTEGLRDAYCPKAVHGMDTPYPGCPLEISMRTGEAAEVDLHDDATGRHLISCIYPTVCTTAEGHAVYAHVIRDVTELREAQAQLIQSNRLSTVGTLAAGIIHEIANPLTCVINGLQSALMAVSSLEEPIRCSEYLGDRAEIVRGYVQQLREELQDASDAANVVAGICRDVRGLGSVNDEDMRPVDVHRAIKTALTIARHRIQGVAELVMELGVTPKVRAAEGRLCQVFINLLLNAARAIDAGSPTTNQIRVQTRTEGGMAVVEIRDSGKGIPEELKERIFDAHFTTQPQSRGSGLGLWICRNIVASLGGTITVSSQQGDGSTFAVRLPAATGDDQ